MEVQGMGVEADSIVHGERHQSRSSSSASPEFVIARVAGAPTSTIRGYLSSILVVQYKSWRV
jgi:hypothetical protein